MGLFRRKVEVISPTQASAPLGPGYVTAPAPSTSASVPTPSAPDARQPGDTAPFSLVVGDVFSITGRGTVVTGQVATGVVRVGDQVRVSTSQGEIESVVSGLEAFRKTLREARAGDNIGLLLRGVGRGQVARGDVITRA